MAFRRKDDHRYRASDSDTRLTRFRPKYKAAHDKSSERELPEICRYCVRAHKLFDSDTMLCERKGKRVGSVRMQFEIGYQTGAFIPQFVHTAPE